MGDKINKIKEYLRRKNKRCGDTRKVFAAA
jgi:hypothetical protein